MTSPTSNKRVAADTGPLIALARVRLLDLLPALFERVVLPPMVLSECVARPDRGEGELVRAAIDAGWLEVLAPRGEPPVWGIDPGETSALLLAQETGARLLIDDKAGRSVANRLGVVVIGSVGVLVLAKRRGLLTSVRPALDHLSASGYYLSESVVADTLRLAGE
ncbi:MAG: DUF3368 domain-containing protein [Thiotrichales bacterium]